MKSQLDKNLNFVSIVLLASQIEKLELLQELQKYLVSRYTDYEILIVDDRKKIFAAAEIIKIQSVPCVRYLELSYPVEHEIAISAGVENAIGDFVFIFNITQDPVETIAAMIECCEQDPVIDIVIGVSLNTHKSLGYKVFRPFANSLLESIEYRLPKNATSLRCLSRVAVNAATRTGNEHHQIFSRISNCGLNTSAFGYTVHEPLALEKSLPQAVNDTFQILIFNSTKPLRWVCILGLFGALFSLLFAAYSFFAKLFSDHIAEGWSSTVMLVSFLFMLLFMMLSVFGEYLVRILNSAGQTKPYWINKETYSSSAVLSERPNVVESSNVLGKKI